MDKSERLLNLLIMLLVQRHFVAKARIREIIYPSASTDAFEKMFERDKEELRSLGVPVEVGAMDAYFDDEPGYRIPPDRFALPDVSLTPDEAAVVGLATKVWQHARLAEATTDAVRKLTASGIDVDLTALDIVEPRLSADEPSFDVFWEATLDRVPVRFDYVRAGANQARTRHLQPWGVARYAGRWYVVGFDTDRGAERIFRLSRVQGQARRDGPPRSYEIPAGTDVGEVARRLAPRVQAEQVVLLVRDGAGPMLRRDADRIDLAVPGPGSLPGESADTGWDRVVITRDPLGLVDEILGYGPDVVVKAPSALVEQVVSRLRAGLGLETAAETSPGSSPDPDPDPSPDPSPDSSPDSSTDQSSTPGPDEPLSAPPPAASRGAGRSTDIPRRQEQT